MGVQIHKNALKRSPCCNTSYAFQTIKIQKFFNYVQRDRCGPETGVQLPHSDQCDHVF